MEQNIHKLLQEILSGMKLSDISFSVENPADFSHGDYSSNIALVSSKSIKKPPMEIAEEIVEKVKKSTLSKNFEIVEAVKPGFINFYLSKETLFDYLNNAVLQPETIGNSDSIKGKRIMVEYAHPNTHKEMHIGHLRTLITGEAISRLLESQGATVFRANYQGDIGPHVARALYGIKEIIKEKHLTFSDVENWSNYDKAHFLGQAYVRGNKDYKIAKERIDQINDELYQRKAGHYMDLYKRTRQWSLAYYDEFYARFYTKFNRLFFESEMDQGGTRIVKEHLGKIFTQSDGAIIFKGEPYGFHTRVFITKAGHPTYEGKEIYNALMEYDAFPFDKKIHIVASEQSGYFQVVFKALELLDSGKFKGKQYHLPMGMVHLSDRKMSSRTGEILTVDWLIGQVKEVAEKLFSDEKISPEQKDQIIEDIVIGGIKYSVLRGATKQDVAFSIDKSLSLEGDSGPYIQYAYVRTQSILKKAAAKSESNNNTIQDYHPNEDEMQLIRILVQFPDAVKKAATELAPSTVISYLYTLAKTFNSFYQNQRIIDAIGLEERQFRLLVAKAVGYTLARGLNLLGIAAPEMM